MGSKNPFFRFFSEVFGSRPLTPFVVRPNLLSNESLMKIHNRAKFYLDSICGSQVINFQKFSWRWSIHELSHFRGFLGPNLPKIASILVKLAPEVALKERNTVLKFL